MGFLLRNIAATDPDGTPNYYGVPAGTGAMVLLHKEDAKRWESRDQLQTEMAILGMAWGNAAYLVIEDEDEDPKAAEEHRRKVLTEAIQIAEEWMPQSGKFTLEHMSVLRVAIAQSAPWLVLKA